MKDKEKDYKYVKMPLSHIPTYCINDRLLKEAKLRNPLENHRIKVD